MVRLNLCFNAGFTYRRIALKNEDSQTGNCSVMAGVIWRVRNHVNAGGLD